MVTAVTSFGRSGLYDWVAQRVSAVVLAAYTLFLVGFILLTPEVGYAEWKELYSYLWMRVFSLLALLSMVAHAWIGLWAVLTDYLTTRLLGTKGTVLRVSAQLLMGVVILTYTVWGIEILWGF
ncbi:MAG: succinate dehydrogenase, hydrophobic membrane anchor protein [Gammaproteobacteria bacterium]|uniref:succinate dehydrogenase, hydrophobic membrane anchor protein n=1 Tax=Pseudomaricurvus alcaniphilus TaxID=1166482 RepID=UPI00140C0E38|nr:succinate dehydrogenase, hydrophobic membrane anchor protein [Pseudomaricurvus alcaniphilus]MBR9912480.1 succinate dehydrogenase, hydrophobic membrane anchor protein [Gammaproteobacteria bacterium]NHN37423.1 succinate dehydrogenase, hydrophobic membrane anchor protein [Pseudomaricurvus alcaniphilus]